MTVGRGTGCSKVAFFSLPGPRKGIHGKREERGPQLLPLPQLPSIMQLEYYLSGYKDAFAKLIWKDLQEQTVR